MKTFNMILNLGNATPLSQKPDNRTGWAIVGLQVFSN